jgi:hypothetical protein
MCRTRLDIILAAALSASSVVLPHQPNATSAAAAGLDTAANPAATSVHDAQTGWLGMT